MSLIGIDPWVRVYILVIAAALGAVMGSFLNCMGWRLAHGESVLKGRSHCGACGHVLGVPDLVPIFSYLFLKGRCRYCGEKYGPDCLVTEVMMAAACVLILLRFDLTPQALMYMGATCALMALSIVDLEIMEIPDRFHVFLILWWLIFLPINAWFEGEADLMVIAKQAGAGLAGGLVIAGAILLISLVFDKILGKESMGGGDIKLFFSVGLYLGIAGGLFNLILSCFMGLFMAALLRRKKIPFGPSISLASFVSFLLGTYVINWYIGLF